MVFYLDFVDPKINIINVCIAPSTLHICIQSITFYMVLALHLVGVVVVVAAVAVVAAAAAVVVEVFIFLAIKIEED